jgi:hypothetical protein
MKKWYYLVSALCLFLFSVLGYAAFDSIGFSTVKDLEISRITPKGDDVPGGRQIVIQFNRPVVPLGRMERKAEEIPVTITPALKGRWYWLNTSALACQLDEKNALVLSTTYTVVVKPGIMTEDGTTLKHEVRHSFTTKRPSVANFDFFTWASPGTPVIRLSFDQPVLKPSVERHLFFLTKTKKTERVNLKAEPDPGVYQNGEQVGEGDDPEITRPDQSPNERIMVNGVEARSIWLVRPVKELPRDSSADLWVEVGLVSAYGPVQGITHEVVVAVDTFPAFRFLGVQCTTLSSDETVLIPANKMTDVKAIKANPLGGVSLVFSAPVMSKCGV